MARRTPTIEREGNRLTVVAVSAEEAMAAAGDAAPGFRTVSIESVRRGGIAGFFSTSMVQLVAETDPRPVGGLALASADDLLASLCSTEGPFAGRLAVGLQRSMLTATEPAPAEAPPALPASTTVAATLPTLTPVPAPVEAEPTAWSVAALRAIGLPDSLVADVARHHPTCEVTWSVALLMALRPLCHGALPATAVFAGSSCASLADPLGIRSVDAADLPASAGDVAVPTAAGADLDALADDRPVHLVVGGNWRHLAAVRPAAVSAASPADLVDALRVAVAWAAPLGWLPGADEPVRIDPFLVADQLRLLLAGRPPAPARRPPRPRRTTAAAPVATKSRPS